MDVVDRLVSAIEALPRDLSNEEVIAVFAASDLLAASLTAAVDRIDPAADGAVTLRRGVGARGLSGRRDRAGALVVRAALDAATTVDGDGEVRPRARRHADASMAISRHYLDHATTAATSRGSRPDVSVVVTLDDLDHGVG